MTRAARAWALRRGRGAGAAQAALLHGAWRWEPARGLRYRLLLRLALAPAGAAVAYVRVSPSCKDRCRPTSRRGELR